MYSLAQAIGHIGGKWRVVLRQERQSSSRECRAFEEGTMGSLVLRHARRCMLRLPAEGTPDR
jgi:hypothetical protein